MAASSRPCDALKTHIYTETGRIQALTEQYISNDRSYVKQRLPQTTFDAAIGEDPVTLRYRSSMPEKAAYLDILTGGNSSQTDYAPDCSGEQYGFVGPTNNRGSAGCSLPTTSMTAGYDTFGRSLKGRAWKIGPVCALDLLLRNHAGAYIQMLRTDPPKRGMEEFNEALEDEVIAASDFNFSAVGQWTYAAGQFPAIPTGTLDIGLLKRIKTFMILQGWEERSFEIEVGRDAFEAAVRAWNTANNVQIHVTKISDDTNGLIGRDMFEFEGVRVVLTDYPTRGYLRQTGSGYQFVRVPRAINRAGTGGGVVATPNPDYLNCFTTCDGQIQQLYEVGFFVNPRFAERQALAPVQLAGLKVANMNMEVRMFDGNWIDCNEDNTKFFLRMAHVYGFRPRNPELGGALLYLASPQPIRVTAGTCEVGCLDDVSYDPVEMAGYPPPPSDACFDASQEEVCEDAVTHYAGQPTDEVGVMGLLQIKAFVPADSDVATFFVNRVDGSDGAASIHVASANGTASAGSDYTAVSTDLEWADGESGVKSFTVTILAAATPGQNFLINLSSPVGATLDADADQMTVTIIPQCD